MLPPRAVMEHPRPATTVASNWKKNDMVYALPTQRLTFCDSVDPLFAVVIANRAEWAPFESTAPTAPTVGLVVTFCDQKASEPPLNSNPLLVTAWVAVQEQAEVVLQSVSARYLSVLERQYLRSGGGGCCNCHSGGRNRSGGTRNRTCSGCCAGSSSSRRSQCDGGSYGRT
jgi:hypothetical protein